MCVFPISRISDLSESCTCIWQQPKHSYTRNFDRKLVSGVGGTVLRSTIFDKKSTILRSTLLKIVFFEKIEKGYSFEKRSRPRNQKEFSFEKISIMINLKY